MKRVSRTRFLKFAAAQFFYVFLLNGFMLFGNRVLSAQALPANSMLHWESELNANTFARAKAEQKLVLLDLEAVWCHWCHVMEEKTYANKEIEKILSEHFLLVKIDQDARPDLRNRYLDYGWPATIIYNSSGVELDKLSGFIEPEEFLKIAKDHLLHPDKVNQPVKVVYAEKSTLSPELRDELLKRYLASIDSENGGLKSNHKYLDYDTVEYAWKKGMLGDSAMAAFLNKTLKANLSLIDPVWGGVYQYSVHGVWSQPHYEKLAWKQAGDLRAYALAYAVSKDPVYLEGVKNIARYVRNFLRDPQGGFYTSQDADVIKGEHSEEYFALDDSSRRKHGVPVVDTHIYSSENGKLITAFALSYAYTSDASYLDDAIAAAQWILKNRALPEGGYRHGEDSKPQEMYLCDTLFMGQGFLTLYSVTGERSWLKLAERSADFLEKNFLNGNSLPGFITAKLSETIFQSEPLIAENIDAARFLISLRHYTGNEKYQPLAERAMRFLASREIALQNRTEVGIVLADEELNNPPTHLTVEGSKSDSVALQFFQEILRYPAPVKRTEWWDRAEGAMPNPDVQYPPLPKPAAFVCTSKRCSLPIFKVEDIKTTADKLSATN